MTALDCVVVGGGQAGLATGHYLQKYGVDFVIVDDAAAPGGSWRHAWDTLTLFSPASASNLPGLPMPRVAGFPPASHVIDYLARYEKHYDLPVRHGVRVDRVGYSEETGLYSVGDYTAQTVVGATGTWLTPFIPAYPGSFAGRQWHTKTYPGSAPFRGASVSVVGGANSGAQIATDLLLDDAVGDVTWYTRGAPRWMPDDVDGRVLFRRNRERLNAMLRGEEDPGSESELGDIVVVPAVKKARDAGLLESTPMFDSLDEVQTDHLIWCTGFRPTLGPFRHVRDTPRLYLVGYGTWTGPGSATITGVAPFAKRTAQQIRDYLTTV